MRRKRIRRELSLLPPKPCIFCGGKSGSLEDIVANWILDQAQIRGRKVNIGFAMRGETFSDRVTEERPIEEFLLPSVCTPCNTGWMSGLERHVQPLLKDLLAPVFPENHRLLIGKLSSYHNVLAIWAMKTACTFGEKMSVRVSPDYVRRLRDGKEFELQLGVRLELAVSEASQLVGHMTNHCPLFEASDGRVEQRYNDSGFVLILQINHLILRLWHCPFTIRQQMKKRNPVEVYPTFYMPRDYLAGRNGVLASRPGYVYENFQQFQQEVFHVRIPVQAVARCEVDLLC